MLVSRKPFAGIVWVTSPGMAVSDTLAVSLACSRTFSVAFRTCRLNCKTRLVAGGLITQRFHRQSSQLVPKG